MCIAVECLVRFCATAGKLLVNIMVCILIFCSLKMTCYLRWWMLYSWILSVVTVLHYQCQMKWLRKSLRRSTYDFFVQLFGQN